MNLVNRAAFALIAGALAFSGGLTTFLQAAPQVGTVVANSPFELRGARVTATGVPSWPVSAGDEIATEDSPVSFQFPDGSQITLEANSRARIEGTKKSPIFRLLECTADYRLKRLSSVILYRNDRIERISKVEGQYTMGCKAAIAAGAAGVGAASAGVGAASVGAASAGAAGAATAGAASAGVASAAAGAASATVATAGIASAATIGASAAAAAGVATAVGVVSATSAGTPAPLSTSQ